MPHRAAPLHPSSLQAGARQVALAAVSVIVAAACGGRADRGAPVDPADTVAPAPRRTDTARTDTAAAGAATDTNRAGQSAAPPFSGTAGVSERSGSGMPVLLEAVETGRHEGYDRVVFRFAERVPGYHIEYVDRPVRACGSGEPVPLAGDAWLEVRLAPAQAHDDAGRPTIQARRQSPGLPNLEALVLTCDFEADVSWVLGLARPSRYRVLTLRSPARLVVDVLH